MRTEHVFVDTNILVYAHDADAGERHEQAVTLVKSLWNLPYPPAISSQVVQELVASLAKKKAAKADCRRIVEIYLDWEIVALTPALTVAALEIWEHYQTSWWDALIVAAAQEARATLLWSEDLQSGRVFDGVRVVNPFNT